MGINEAIAELAAHAGQNDDNLNEVVRLLGDKSPKLHQALYQKGFDTGYGRKSGELDEVKGNLTKATSERDQLKQQLEEARRQNPDVAAIHKQYQDQIAELKTAHERVVAEKDGVIRNTTVQRAQADLTARLVALGTNGRYAGMLARDLPVTSRLKPDEKTGVLQVLQKGRDIPIAAAGDKDPVALLAEELFADVPAEFRTGKSDTGSGDRPGGGSGIKKVVEGIREEDKKDRERTGQGEELGPAGVPKSLGHMTIGAR